MEVSKLQIRRKVYEKNDAYKGCPLYYLHFLSSTPKLKTYNRTQTQTSRPQH